MKQDKKIINNAPARITAAYAKFLKTESGESAPQPIEPVLDNNINRADALVAETIEQGDRQRAFSERVAIDGIRDVRVTAAFMVTRGFTRCGTPKIEAAAAEVEKVLNRYGSIRHDKVDAQSIRMESLLADLNSATVKPNVALVPGLADIVLSLQQVQTDFDRASHAYFHFHAEQGRPLREISDELTRLINDEILPHIKILAHADPSYQQFADRVFDRLTMVNANVRASRKKQQPPYPEAEGGEAESGSGVNPDDGADAIVPDKPGQGGGDKPGQGGSDDESRPMV